MAKKSANVYSTLGASNHATGERAQYDLYCTHPKAVEELLKLDSCDFKQFKPRKGFVCSEYFKSEPQRQER